MWQSLLVLVDHDIIEKNDFFGWLEQDVDSICNYICTIVLVHMYQYMCTRYYCTYYQYIFPRLVDDAPPSSVYLLVKKNLVTNAVTIVGLPNPIIRCTCT